MCHLDDDSTGIYDLEDSHDRVSRIGGAVIASKKGKILYKFVCENGSSVIKELSLVKYSKSGARLLAINAELSKNAKVSNNDKNA